MAERTPMPVLLQHIARGLAMQVQWCRTSGIRPPAELAELASMALVWSRAVQDGSDVGGSGGAVDGGLTMSPPPLLVSLPEAARLLDCSLSTVKRLASSGELPTVRVGGARRVRRADIESYVDSLGSSSFRDRLEAKAAGSSSRPAPAAPAAAAGRDGDAGGLRDEECA